METGEINGPQFGEAIVRLAEAKQPYPVITADMLGDSKISPEDILHSMRGPQGLLRIRWPFDKAESQAAAEKTKAEIYALFADCGFTFDHCELTRSAMHCFRRTDAPASASTPLLRVLIYTASVKNRFQQASFQVKHLTRTDSTPDWVILNALCFETVYIYTRAELLEISGGKDMVNLSLSLGAREEKLLQNRLEELKAWQPAAKTVE